MGRQTCIFASFLSFLLICRCSSTTNTITFNQTLKDGNFLFSESRSFVLGFFTPQNSIGNRRYIGIWFQQIPVKTIVWVANRDSPVNGESGVLFIDAATGNLVIGDEKTNASVWSTNLTGGAKPVSYYSARLLNNGNLVLGPEENESPAWQSFDFPTNTLLPSMKLSIDKKHGGGRRVLTSWKSADDPATGQYALGMELSGTPQLFLYRSWAQIWRAGPWNGVELSGSPEISQINPAVNLNYTETDGEVSLTFSLRDQSVQSILVLNESGTVNRLTWQGEDKGWVGIWSAPEDKCDVYDGCGAFSKCDLAALECSCLPGFELRSGQDSSSDGCTRGNNTDASSLCHKGEGFTKLSKVKLPDAKTGVVNHRSIGLKECNQICLNNCSCTAYTTANISSGRGCITWYGELNDLRDLANGGQDLYLRISAGYLGKLENKSKGHRRRVIAVSLVVLGAAVILLLCCLAMHIRKGKQKRRNAMNERLQSYGESVMGEHIHETGSTIDMTLFPLKTIHDATDNFSVENKLGQGGFGSVYKGKLPNGQVVAIKRLSRTSGQGIEEFKNEVTLIAKLQHKNLVRLLGCSIQQGEKMLVYEYMPNHSLDHFIFGTNRSEETLDWTKRFDIILGIARGLLYLHRDSRLRIIHRDLKPSNVLLDASMNPKISDFGMARIFEIGQNVANTNRVVGTYGYMSPEYAMEGQFSVKSDVFSFGVLLLEIVCGRKNKNPIKETSLNLMGDVWDLWREGKAIEIVDPLLGESYDVGKVLRCIHVGLLCVQAMMNDRPTMSQVVFMLCNETKLPNPNQPGFILLRKENCIPSSSTTSTKSHSINSMSFTKLEGR